MGRLVGFHLRDDRAGHGIALRQTIEMSAEMRLDLLLCDLEEGQRLSVAEGSSSGTQGDRACIPKRIQQARTTAEGFHTLTRPGEVIEFLVSSGRQFLLDGGMPGKKRLTLIEPLSGDFACVVYAHQGDRARLFFWSEFDAGDGCAGRRPAGVHRTRHRTQSPIGHANEYIGD